MSELEAGNIVRLKSGGPDMVVESINRKNPSGVFARIGAHCSWFNKDGERQSGVFAESALEKVEPKG